MPNVSHIYDVCEDANLLKSIASGYFSINGVKPKVELERFGSNKWWRSLEDSGVLIVKNGRIEKLLSTGQGGNFPEFVFEANGERPQLEIKGDEASYKEGLSARVTYAKERDIFCFETDSPFSLLADSNFLLRVDAL